MIQKDKGMKILSIGEIIWDVYQDKKCIGGAPLNFAAHVSLLGAESYLISAVGKDDLGVSAKEYIKDFGVKTDFIKTNEKTTGICDVTVDDRGVPSYYVRRDTAYDNIVIDENDTESINDKSFDLFYFGTLIQRQSVSEEALKTILSECPFPEIFCDVNLRPNCYRKETVLTCLNHATVLKISDEEEPLLRELGIYGDALLDTESIAETLAKQYPNLKIIIITMGEKGAFAYRTSDSRKVYQPAVPVKVASTVGAGDSFSAAFAKAYLDGASLGDALKSGAELSSFVCSRTEAVPRK